MSAIRLSRRKPTGCCLTFPPVRAIELDSESPGYGELSRGSLADTEYEVLKAYFSVTGSGKKPSGDEFKAAQSTVIAQNRAGAFIFGHMNEITVAGHPRIRGQYQPTATA